MKEKINKIIIAKDGFPLELFKNRPITNFIRRLLHSSHKECRDCYLQKQARKNTNENQVLTNQNKEN